MANERISQLSNLLAADVADIDLFPITDISVPETKNLKAGDLRTYILTNGCVSSSYAATSSVANIALYALNAPTAAQVAYATSSLSSSYSKTSSVANIALYALNAPTAAQVAYATSSLSSSYASSSYSSSYSTTSSYASVSQTANIAISAITANTALVALSLNNTNANQSGNQASYITYTNVLYNTSSVSVDKNQLVTESILAQIDKIAISDPIQTSSLVNITTCGLVAVLHNIGNVYSSSWNPNVSLIVQNLTDGITYSLATASYSSYLQSVGINITNTSSVGAIKPFYLTGNINLSSGSYRTYVKASYFDIGDNSISLYFFGAPDTTPSFRLSSNASNFVVTPYVSGIPMISSDLPINFDYSASHNLFGTVTSSYGTNILQNLTTTTPSSESYLTYLNSKGNTFNTLTNLWTATSLKTLILDNSRISYIDGVPASLVTMSCLNCGLDTLPPLSSVSYLNVSNTAGGINNITDLSSLPSSMSYLNVSQNGNINKWPISMMKGITHLNISNCNLQQDDLDIVTSMLVAEVSASYIISGSLDISLNGLTTNPYYTNTVAWHNTQLLTSSLYSWTVNY